MTSSQPRADTRGHQAGGTVPTRVLQVVLSLNPGGTERLVVELATRLHAEFPMAVCCLDGEGLWAEQLKGRGISVLALDRPRGFVPRLGHAIAAVAKRHRADVIHAHHYSPFIYTSLARLWYPQARVVYTEHGRLSDAAPSLKRRVANTIFARIPHAVFSVSADLRAHLAAEGFASQRVGVIYNGVDIGALPAPADRNVVRRQLAVDDRTIVIGTLARLDPVKDLPTLFAAIAVLPERRSVVLLIVGDGPERLSLERVAGDLGIADRVKFIGYRDDARRWLAGCDIYVNCSVSEGVSLTILEAMAAGLPVVATRVGGTPEIVDESTGYLVPSRNASALAGAMSALVRDPALRRRMGAEARRRVEAAFTINRMVDAYRAVYTGGSPYRESRVEGKSGPSKKFAVA